MHMYLWFGMKSNTTVEQWLESLLLLLIKKVGSARLRENDIHHGLKNNTRLTRFCDPTKKKSVRWRHCQSDIGGPSVCVWLLAEIPSSCAVFSLNDRKSGVNRHLLFYPFQKKSEMCCVYVRIIHTTMAPTRHISQLKYDFFLNL